MTEPVSMNPDGLRKAAAMFDDLADRGEHSKEALISSIDGRGEVWGDDKPGHKWADGPNGYIANRGTTLDAVSQLVQVFRDNATNLRDAAKTFEENERSESPNPG